MSIRLTSPPVSEFNHMCCNQLPVLQNVFYISTRIRLKLIFIVALNVYHANFRWHSIAGTKSGGCNWVKQGTILSAILFAVYTWAIIDKWRTLEAVGTLATIIFSGICCWHCIDGTALKIQQTTIDVSVSYARKHNVVIMVAKVNSLSFPQTWAHI